MADRLIELLYENNVRCDIGIESLAEDIRSIFADVQPVRRGKWIDTHGTYIDELDGWYMESKCLLCGKYTVSYEKYGVHQKCEYCSHCGKPMK